MKGLCHGFVLRSRGEANLVLRTRPQVGAEAPPSRHDYGLLPLRVAPLPELFTLRA